MNILSSAERQKIELFIESLIEQEIISQSDIEDYFVGNELSEQEKLIIDNLKNGKDLTLEEKTHIAEITKPKLKVKCKSLIKSKNKFIAFIVEYKINTLFNILWKNYPKKVGREIAHKAFVKVFYEFKYGDVDKAFMQLKKRLEKYIYSIQGNDKQFILHFSTWLNQKRWNDDLGD